MAAFTFSTKSIFSVLPEKLTTRGGAYQHDNTFGSQSSCVIWKPEASRAHALNMDFRVKWETPSDKKKYSGINADEVERLGAILMILIWGFNVFFFSV